MRKIKLNNHRHALIDDSDYPLISQFRWHVVHPYRKCFYAGTQHNGRLVLMHRMILGANKGQLIDHINHNGIDNRRKNLRFCTPTQNCMNKTKRHCKNDTPYKGIYRGYKGTWRACIRLSNVTIHLGSHKTQEDAARAYNKEAKRLFGKFAHLNKIKKQAHRQDD